MLNNKILLIFYLIGLSSCGPFSPNLEGKWVDANGNLHFKVLKNTVIHYVDKEKVEKYSQIEINFDRGLLIFGNINEEMSYRTFFKKFNGDSIEFQSEDGSEYVLFKKSL